MKNPFADHGKIFGVLPSLPTKIVMVILVFGIFGYIIFVQ